jgi:hypothetical protein
MARVGQHLFEPVGIRLIEFDDRHRMVLSRRARGFAPS